MRFLATADWQLGMTAHYLSDEARSRFHQARFDAVRRIGELAASRGAAFVVVCGDVFESNQLDRSIISRAFEALRLFTVPVVLLPGNHDPLDAASIYDAPAFADRVPERVHVLRDGKPYEVVPGAEIVGAPWFSKRPAGDLVAAACEGLGQPPPGTIRVIAGHGAVSTLNPDAESVATIDVPALTGVLREGRAHVAVLGDRHSTTEVAEAIWYPGAPEVTARRETDPGNVLLIEVDAATGAVTVERLHVGRWSFVTLAERLDGGADVERLAAKLADLPDKERTAVWLVLTGTLSTAEKARLDEVVDGAADLFARIDHWQRHMDLAVIPDGADFEDLALGGFAQSALVELVELVELAQGSAVQGSTARGPTAQGASGQGASDQAATAQDALGLLYRFAGGGR